MKPLTKPEVMSPAGYWPQLQAAIEAGADATYFGLKHFTARAKVGFTLGELPEVMQTLHRRGVKGYVTFNTLVFDHELSEAAKTLAAIAEAGADAIIVQDVGMAQLAKQIAPDLEVHGSTQMSLTSAEGIALAQQFGVSRVVLARELSLAEVRAIRAQTSCELEMFVHGALCVSYSGQCFSSEAWGGRSANRGQCAQACRLPYQLVVDELVRPLGDARYLLSPGDLYALQQMAEIVQIGVSALKIEGRYKDADYVALTTRAYRRAVDEAWAGLPLSMTRPEELQLEQVYSRGLGAYFVTGTNHQMVVNGRSPRHRGLLMGQVTQVLPGRILISPSPSALISPLKAGDGVVFDAADWRSPEEREEGGRLYQVRPAGKKQLELQFGHGDLNFKRIRPGDKLWRTHDPALEKVSRPYTNANSPLHKQPITVTVVAKVGQPLQTIWALSKEPTIQVVVTSEELLVAAQQHGLSLEVAQNQLGRLGNTPYELADLVLELEGQPFVPGSVLNQLRRQAVELLAAKQSQPPAGVIHPPLSVLEQVKQQLVKAGQTSQSAQLHLLVRTPEQLAAAIELRPDSITLDYLDLYGLRPAVQEVQAMALVARIASPRILKPNEQRIINFLLKLDCPIVVRSTGLLQRLQGQTEQPLIGDFSLNTANSLTAHTFLGLGLTRLTPSHDLNGTQISDLAQAIGPEQVEVVAYHHLPVFHTEHCVFCRFLSSGTSYKDCGQPCDKHKVALRDMSGREHPLMADVGCRNTVFGAEAQEASHHLQSWRTTGICHFRLEFVHESAESVLKIGQAFRGWMSGRVAPTDLAHQLRQIAPQGTTEGSFFVPDNYLTLPILQ